MADTPAPEFEKLPLVAWRVDDPDDVGPTLTSDPEKARFHSEIGRAVAALCRLSDANALLASKDAEIARLRADAERWQKWLPWIRGLNRKPYDLAVEIHRIDAALAAQAKGGEQ